MARTGRVVEQKHRSLVLTFSEFSGFNLSGNIRSPPKKEEAGVCISEARK
jgi:hypothetical protein